VAESVRARLTRYLNQVIDGALARERIVGTVVLVSVDGKIVYRRAAGWADREARRPMAEDTIFRLASVTKLIVSSAAVGMVESGQIALDDPITKWLPEFRPRLVTGEQPEISIRQLLTHTAGLDYGFQPGGGVYRRAGISNGLDQPGLSMEEALRRLASVSLLFAPGAAWNYSLATDVVGAVLARAAGSSLPEIVRQRVTAPLDMADTEFAARDIDRLATPYADAMPRPVVMEDPHDVPFPTGVVRFSPSRILNPQSYPSGGAGMAGTAGALLKLLEAIRCDGGQIVNANSARLLTTNALPDNVSFVEPGWTYGLGAIVLRDSSIARTPHETGTWRGGGAYGHEYFVNPRRNLSMVMFSNTACEGTAGAYPMDLRDAAYYALTTASEATSAAAP
jgi:CubicO group peptidase (beta-lactamase class C family)